MFSIYSNNPAKANTYPLRLIASLDGFSNTASLDFQVILVDLCSIATLSIQSSIVSSLTITYNIGDPAHVETLDDSKVIATPAIINCPNIVFTIEDQSNNAIDGTIFTYTSATN